MGAASQKSSRELHFCHEGSKVASTSISPLITFHISQLHSTSASHQTLVMARENRTRKSESKVTIVEPAAQRRSSRLSDTAAPKSYRYAKQTGSPSIQRPVRETPSKPAKMKQKISIASVLKRPQKEKAKTSRVVKKEKRREATPELDLMEEFQGM